MVVNPLGNRIFVQEEKATNVSAGGLIIEGTLGNSKLFRVVNVGPDVKHVTEGDSVVIDLSKAVPVAVAGSQGIVVAEDAVLASVQK